MAQDHVMLLRIKNLIKTIVLAKNNLWHNNNVIKIE